MSELGGSAVALSVYEEAYKEAQRHKWIESEKHGRDLGEVALKDWFRKHWFDFCRYRRNEHLNGHRCFREFGEENFGRLYTLIVNGDLLTERILDRIADGQENLGVLCWAIEWGIATARVREILKELDINRYRLDPHYV